jgi:hypothetical protein
VLKNLNEVYTPRPESSRRSWQKGTDLASLDNKTILTSPPSAVKTTERSDTTAQIEELISPRKAWDQPHKTVLEALQLADLTNSNGLDAAEARLTVRSTDSGDSGINSASKQAVKGQTFVIGTRVSVSARSGSSAASSSSSNMLMNEKPPSIIDKLDSMEATVRKLADIMSPEKLATMKQTNQGHFLLGVTLGQFDLKNTKVRLIFVLILSFSVTKIEVIEFANRLASNSVSATFEGVRKKSMRLLLGCIMLGF